MTTTTTDTTTEALLDAAAREILRCVAEEGWARAHADALAEGSSAWDPRRYDLLDGDMAYCRKQGLDPWVVQDRVRKMLTDAVTAAQVAGWDSARAVRDVVREEAREAGGPITSALLREAARQRRDDDQPWGEIDGAEDVLGREGALAIARDAEVAELLASADALEDDEATEATEATEAEDA